MTPSLDNVLMNTYKSIKLETELKPQHSLVEMARINMAKRKKGIKKEYMLTHKIDEFKVREIEVSRFKELTDDRVSNLDDRYLKEMKKTLERIQANLLENY